jgi:hypothetical protein
LALWFVIRQRQCLGGKIPALTVQETRRLFSHLLHKPLTAAQIAAQSTALLRRNVESRIYAWFRSAGRLPPSRRFPFSEQRLQ